MLLQDSNSNPLQGHLDGQWVVIKKIAFCHSLKRNRTKLEGRDWKDLISTTSFDKCSRLHF